MEKLVLINPYQQSHIKMIEQLEQDNHMNPQFKTHFINHSSRRIQRKQERTK